MLRSLVTYLALALLAGCASSAVATPPVGGRFVCANGTEFRVDFVANEAVITTATDTYRLQSRPSSIGRRYASATASFIQDEDRAALNGIPGLVFRRCQRVGADALPIENPE